jgi:hypothetical protein
MESSGAKTPATKDLISNHPLGSILAPIMVTSGADHLIYFLSKFFPPIRSMY